MRILAFRVGWTAIELGLVATVGAPADRYVEVTAESAPVYSLKAGGEVLGRVSRGTRLKVSGRRGPAGEWHEVYLFSGEARYLRRSAAKLTDYRVEPPTNETVRRQVFAALLAAEDKAQKEADRLVPSAEIMRNIGVMRVLDDKYKLQAMQRFKIDPPVYGPIVVEGATKNWLRQ
jgi:hypothetical protein